MIDFNKIGSYIVALAVGIVYGIKVWDDLSNPIKDEATGEVKEKNKASIWRNVIYSAFGSALVCLLVAEGLISMWNFPNNFALLCGAFIGFIGSDVFKDVIFRFLESKFNKRGD